MIKYEKRLKELEIETLPPFIAIDRYSNETQEQAISKQYPDGLPKAERYVFLMKFVPRKVIST